ncbi:bifunctional phosphopantothenoylcysteine decarboxylase/phosphopantothenate--cysteine ligase CoaBC [bacterium]|nr:MAG: bifunctional phosphopantothenoylcysteine decarboxylase/phosphopantothenate--cysteine ligase CoaBC [bacterium]
MQAGNPKYAGKKILIGMTGGIACYKMCELVRSLKKNGAEVRVIMTRHATEFISPLTLETLSGYKVTTETFPPYDSAHTEMTGTHHIDIANWPDIFLIAPAGGNMVGKIANGIADEILSTVVMACPKPILLALAMNDKMYLNPIVQKNIQTLREFNYGIIDPETGFLAEGYEGVGRLADIEKIIWKVEKALFGNNSLINKKILVTAGPTHESLDPVRFLTNHSSGRMGYAVAKEAVLQGAGVTLISGPTHLPPPQDVRLVTATSAEDMARAVDDNISDHDVLIMAAAVADFTPYNQEDQKIKKSEEWILKLKKTTDILSGVASKKGNKIVVGFALETENEIQNAQMKLKSKNLNFIVLNNPKDIGAGFNTKTNKITIIDQNHIEKLPLMTKEDVAKIILNRIIKIL